MKNKKYLLTGFIATVLATVIIVAASYLLCVNTTPGQFVSDELTQRTSGFDEDILTAIKEEAEDCRNLKSGNLQIPKIIDNHIDLFFFAGALLPAHALSAYFTIIWILRFGLAAGSMYLFLKGRMGVKRTYASVIGTTYALQSRLILAGQSASVINMAIIIPQVLAATDYAAERRNFKAYIPLAATVAILAASGTPGVICGVPFTVAATLLICMAKGREYRKIFADWTKALGASAVGFCLSAVVTVPRFYEDTIFDFKQAIEGNTVYYTFFDFVSTAFSGSGGSLDYSAVPTVFFGMFTLILFILFFVNSFVPGRLKALMLVSVILCHLCCAVSLLDNLTGIVGVSSMLTASRIICLTALICCCAGISLKNLVGLEKKHIRGAALAILCTLTAIHAFGGAVSYSFLTLYGPAAAALAAAGFISSFRLEKVKPQVLVSFLALAMLSAFVNTFLTLSLGSVESADVVYSFRPEEDKFTMNIDAEELSVFKTDEDRAIVAPRPEEDSGTYIDTINYLSEAVCGQYLMELSDANTIATYDFTVDGLLYTTDTGLSSAEYEIFANEGDRIFVYCSFAGDITFTEAGSGALITSLHSGPVLKELEVEDEPVYLTVEVDTTAESAGEISIWTLNEGALSQLAASTYQIKNNSVTVNIEEAGDKLMVTSRPYGTANHITYNGSKLNTISYGGYLAADFTASDAGIYEFNIRRNIPGLACGAAVSLCTAICVVIYVYIRNRKKEELNAQ